jgi:aspartate-semialdehyde dehydrogenase
MRTAILGATGLVGRTMLDLLARQSWVETAPRLFTSPRSAGRSLGFRAEDLRCEDAKAADFAGIDLLLASAGAEASRALAPRAVAAGAWVVDNSSAFRRDPGHPLVVPEINGALLAPCRRSRDAGIGGIVANPNCSTIQIALAVAPLDRAFGLREIAVTTLQSVSGAGQKGVDELQEQALTGADDPAAPGRVFPRRIFANAIPAIGAADVDGDYDEETKVRRELRRILDRSALAVSCTAVRVPVVTGHAAACRLVCARPVAPADALAVLREAPGVEIAADPARYRTPAEQAGRLTAHVGRLRRDPDRPDALLLWVVADNLLKGAAWNAVQIAAELAGEPAS